MSERRVLSSELYTDPAVAALSDRAKLVFVGLIVRHCDHWGMCLDSPANIALGLPALRLTDDQARDAVRELARENLVELGTRISDQRPILRLRSWERHQQLRRRRERDRVAMPDNVVFPRSADIGGNCPASVGKCPPEIETEIETETETETPCVSPPKSGDDTPKSVIVESRASRKAAEQRKQDQAAWQAYLDLVAGPCGVRVGALVLSADRVRSLRAARKAVGGQEALLDVIRGHSLDDWMMGRDGKIEKPLSTLEAVLVAKRRTSNIERARGAYASTHTTKPEPPRHVEAHGPIPAADDFLGPCNRLFDRLKSIGDDRRWALLERRDNDGAKAALEWWDSQSAGGGE